ncbi:MAG TPA: sulfurtransferase [candidate division Zixibacteria bacterium]|nr:sulfurtransferase [candidate division Zixibacteria bacterium]
MALISVDELAERVFAGDPRLRLADVRWYLNRPGAGRAAYDAGHIPGAVFVDLEADLSAHDGPGRHPLPNPVDFAHRLGELGIGSEHDVVVYDDAGGTVASRLWWMLDTLGHRSVRVLDGGIGAWQAAGHPVTSEASVHPPAALNLMDRWSRTITREALSARLGSVTLLDARAPERYRGEIEPVDPVPGHIPTARSAPATANLGPDGRFLARDALRRRFETLAASGEVVTSCGSGTTACHNALAMRIAGLPDPVLYVGSYSDWSRSGMPVATGPEPGDPPG